MDPAVRKSAGGISSILDTDLYKLTMQNAVLKHFPNIHVTYAFTNRTPDMKLTRGAIEWLQSQIDDLTNLTVTGEELAWLSKTCPYLSQNYLEFLTTFRFSPSNQVKLQFTPDSDTGSANDAGQTSIHVEGLWVETILYEIPLLALTSEAYFKFVDQDWSHDGQLEAAREKGELLLSRGCVISEFGSRRRRDLYTHELVMQGLVEAAKKGAEKGWKGKLSGTSNAFLAMKFDVSPIGTVAHEWFMGVAAIKDNYVLANQLALQYWIDTFGKGVLGIALTDTFGTPAFLKAFKQKIAKDDSESFAESFAGVRQDSGDPVEYVKVMKRFYEEQGITTRKSLIFSDSLNIERCLQYREVAEAAGFQTSFGIGTFFTNDFKCRSRDAKSVPLNIVIKISSAEGRAAIKLSDNLGKNTGDAKTVLRVKEDLGYQEKAWEGGDEKHRWDQK